MLDKSKIHIPTDEEAQEITKGIKEAPEAYELDNSTLTHMQPAEDVVPEVVKTFLTCVLAASLTACSTMQVTS